MCLSGKEDYWNRSSAERESCHVCVRVRPIKTGSSSPPTRIRIVIISNSITEVIPAETISDDFSLCMSPKVDPVWLLILFTAFVWDNSKAFFVPVTSFPLCPPPTGRQLSHTCCLLTTTLSAGPPFHDALRHWSRFNKWFSAAPPGYECSLLVFTLSVCVRSQDV